jgi:pSer/pThr/pTyr-binding forkhead associated (FHA) protein
MDKICKYFLINLTEGSAEIPLPDNKKISIGRDIDNTIRISNDLKLVSRFHATILVTNNKCTFEDLNDNINGSYQTSCDEYETNPKWNRLKKGVQTNIYDDTVIRLGGEANNPNIAGARVCDIKIVAREIVKSNGTTIIADDED